MPKKLFIASLPSTITQNELAEFFKKFGNIKKIELIREENSPRCKGYAFVTFINPLSAEQVLKQPVFLNGRKLAIREQLHGSSLRKFKESLKKRRMYISNIAKGTRDEDLEALFEQFGSLERDSVIGIIKREKIKRRRLVRKKR